MWLRWLASVGLVFTACAVACSPSAGERESNTTEKIIRGKTSPDTQDFTILLVHTDLSSSFESCSGTLLAPNLVLTARHCVSKTVDQPFGCDEMGHLIGGGTGGTVGADFDPKQLYVFIGNKAPDFTTPMLKADARGVKIFHDTSKILCSHDLALVLLDTKIPTAQIAPVRLDSPPVEGELFTAIGWGVTTTTSMPAMRQMRAGVKVLKVGPSPGDAVTPPIGPGDFEVGEAICQGDSGGPAYAESSSSVIGVVSRGGNGTSSATDPSAGCIAAQNDYTQVAPFKDMILTAYSEAGQDPWIEGQPDPRLAKFSEACTASTDCRSNICNTTYCSQDCSTDKCPSGYDCSAQKGQKICVTHVDPPPAKGCAASPRREDPPGFALAAMAAFGLVAASIRRRRK